MTPRDRRDGERGIALIVMLWTLVLLLGASAAVHHLLIGETELRGVHARATTSFYAAEGALNRGVGDFRNIFLNYNVPTPADFTTRTMHVGSRTVDYLLSPVAGNPRILSIPAGRAFAGLNAIEYRYTAIATATTRSGDTEASLGNEFKVDYIPLFQFVAFYAGDLEIMPGPAMTLHGPIHTNGSLYLNAGETLAIADLPPTIPTVHVSTAGDVVRGRKDSVSCTGSVTISKLADTNTDGALDPQAVPCAGTLSAAQAETWLGAVRIRQPLVTVPAPDTTARGSGTFWQHADVRIVLDLDGRDALGLVPIVVEDASGAVDLARTTALRLFMTEKPGRVFYNDVPGAGHDAATACWNGGSHCNHASYTPPFSSEAAVYPCAGSDLGLYGACAPTVTNEMLAAGVVTARRGGFYNNREHAWVHMLNLNLHDLLAWNRAQLAANQLFDPDDRSDGGIVIFLSVKGPGSNGIATPRYGVRVFGSPRLPFPAVVDPTGATVVSDQAMYVEGDYNVGGGGFAKQPAALIGDSVNVLSSNWSGAAGCRNDCQSRHALASRPAASTSVSAAFLGGVDVTAPGNYNGGLENYPRFHENWDGKTFTYRGSFVSLGTPAHASGPWCGTGGGCNIYDPPLRNWDFDVDFMAAENLPPLTPRTVAVAQTFFTENFR